MKKIMLLLLFPTICFADDRHPVPFGAAAERTVCLRDTADTNNFINSVDFTAGDCASSACCQVSIDGGAVDDCDNQPASVTNGCYTLTASATEVGTGCEAAYFIIDAAGSKRFADKVVTFESTGDPSACYPVAEVNVGAAGITADSFDATVIGHQKTAQAVTSTTITLAASETYGDNVLSNQMAILITDSTNGIWGYRCVKSNVGATDVVTLVAPWAVTPTGTIKYAVIPDQNCNTAVWPQVR